MSEIYLGKTHTHILHNPWQTVISARFPIFWCLDAEATRCRTRLICQHLSNPMLCFRLYLHCVGGQCMLLRTPMRLAPGRMGQAPSSLQVNIGAAGRLTWLQILACLSSHTNERLSVKTRDACAQSSTCSSTRVALEQDCTTSRKCEQNPRTNRN